MNKACPVVLRTREKRRDLLVFEHPLAGFQLVKGTIEPGESVADACVRELFEEAGVVAEAGAFLGKWNTDYDGQVWGFHEMKVQQPLGNGWEHFTEDGGGHVFRFFWQSLEEPIRDGWHPLFLGAIAQLRERVQVI